MRIRWTMLFLWLPLLVISMGARGSVPMYMPAPIAVPPGANPADVSRAVQKALVGRGWTVNETKLAEGSGTSEIRATLNVRVHTLTIKFEFDQERIQIRYVDSTNLGYGENSKGKFIHPKYTTWISNLESDLGAQLLGLSQ